MTKNIATQKIIFQYYSKKIDKAFCSKFNTFLEREDCSWDIICLVFDIQSISEDLTALHVQDILQHLDLIKKYRKVKRKREEKKIL